MLPFYVAFGQSSTHRTFGATHSRDSPIKTLRFRSTLIVIQHYRHALSNSTLTSRGETHILFSPAILNKLFICTPLLIFNLGRCGYHSFSHVRIFPLIFNGVSLLSLDRAHLGTLSGILFHSVDQGPTFPCPGVKVVVTCDIFAFPIMI